MPFGNRNIYLRGSFQYCDSLKNIIPLETYEIQQFRHFSKLRIAYFSGEILSISLKLNFTPNTLGCHWLKVHHIVSLLMAKSLNNDNGENVSESNHENQFI